MTPSWGVSEDDERLLVRLHIRCLPDKDGPLWRFKRIEIILEGQFAYAESVDEARRRQLAALNAPAILHGMARGLLASTTALCVGGPFLLPTVNYLEVARKAARRSSTPKPRERSDES